MTLITSVETPPIDSHILRCWGLPGETRFCPSQGHRDFLKEF